MSARPANTVEGVQKAVVAFVVAAASLVGLFVQFDPNTTETILAVVAGAANVVGVYATRNK